MSFSIDGMASMMTTSTANMNNFNADKVQNSLNKVSSSAKEDELLQVCKDFQSYFIEEVIKEIKNNMTEEDEGADSSVATLTDYHMDSVIEMVSDQVLDQSGNSFTQQLYEQMKRNYGIE